MRQKKAVILKKIILRICPDFIINIYIWYKRVAPICKAMLTIRKTYGKCYILIATPTHGNLGDQAIAYAQRIMLQKCGYGNQIVEFSNEYYCAFKHRIEKKICAMDTVIIDGGGNLGSLWPENEEKMQDIVNRFHKNKIIIFPNTLYYSNSEEAQNLLMKSKRVYNNHQQLTMIARDRASFMAMQKHYPNVTILLTPDVVLSLDGYDYKDISRKGAMLCFRDDHEKTSEVQQDEIRIQFAKRGLSCVNGSTLIQGGGINNNNREEKLLAKLKEFAHYEIVITDRLHAMVFCALTGTPCVVLNNISKKVSGVYEWIKYLPYITITNNPESIMHEVECVLGKGEMFFRSNEMNVAFSLIEGML